MPTHMPKPLDYDLEELHPIGGTHPDYPEHFRVGTDTLRSYGNAIGEDVRVCEKCPMGEVKARCDRSCGWGCTWVDAVTWIQIRTWENTK